MAVHLFNGKPHFPGKTVFPWSVSTVTPLVARAGYA